MSEDQLSEGQRRVKAWIAEMQAIAKAEQPFEDPDSRPDLSFEVHGEEDWVVHAWKGEGDALLVRDSEPSWPTRRRIMTRAELEAEAVRVFGSILKHL